MKRLCCSLILCAAFWTSAGYGQGAPTPVPVNLIPPSPAATQMLRFADYPVSLFTGLVDISVPIYIIEENGISLPINLRYHASGIKYNDVSTGVGLGWMLDAGGSLVYQVYGLMENSQPSHSQIFTKKINELNVTDRLIDMDNDLPKLLELSNRRLTMFLNS